MSFRVFIEVTENSSFPPLPKDPADTAFVIFPFAIVPAGITMTPLILTLSKVLKFMISPVCAAFESIVLSKASTILVFPGIYACLVEVTAVAAVVVLLVEVAVAVAVGVADGVVVSVVVVLAGVAAVVVSVVVAVARVADGVVSVAAKSGGFDINDNTAVQSKIGINLINIFFITNSFLSELNFFV